MVWTTPSSQRRRPNLLISLRSEVCNQEVIIGYRKLRNDDEPQSCDLKCKGQDCGCSAAARLVGEWTFGLFSAVGAATRNTTTGVSKSRRKRPVRNPDVGVVQHRWVNEPLFGLVAAWHTVMGPAFSDIRVHFLPTEYLEQAVNVPAIRVAATPRSLCGRIDFPRTPLIKQEPGVRGSRWSRLYCGALLGDGRMCRQTWIEPNTSRKPERTLYPFLRLTIRSRLVFLILFVGLCLVELTKARYSNKPAAEDTKIFRYLNYLCWIWIKPSKIRGGYPNHTTILVVFGDKVNV